MTGRAPALAAAVLALIPAAALAHVEATSAAGGEVTLTVPNESRSADTVRVSVELPANALGVSVPPTAGWRAAVTTVPLDPPVAIDGATVSQRITTVTWTGGTIRPGQEARFRLKVRVRAGTARSGLAFPTVQRYSDGTVVRWIGPESGDTPAPVLAVALPAVAVSAPSAATTTTPTAAPAAPDSGSGFPVWLAVSIAAVAVAGGAAAGLILKRRRTGAG